MSQVVVKLKESLETELSQRMGSYGVELKKSLEITTKKTTYCGGPIEAGAKPAAICRLLRRVLALPLNMDLLRRDNKPAAIVLVYCGGLLRRANDPP